MDNKNYPEEKLELLDLYLQQALSAEEKHRLEEELNSSEELQKQLVLLQQSQQAIHALAVSERVKAARGRASSQAKGKQVFLGLSSYRITAVAAVLLPLLVVSVLFSSSNPNSVYADNYLSYQLPINRNSQTSKTTIEHLFQNKEYEKLVQAFNEVSDNNKPQKDLFLTAIATMELKEFEQAVQLFESLKKRHSQEKEKLFEQESDFYLALAYAKTDNAAKGKALFNKIRENKRHLYHKNISYWDVWRLSFSE